ncbi:MAG: hypothetical protein FWH42_05780 [Dehalococcoidia bacterium]|nr:hypothetical protein [Dehalococcoidia bacterium]
MTDPIDFSVKPKSVEPVLINSYLLWAEAKANPTDTTKMLTQLVLTIGKAKTFDNHLPPPYLGCFDCENIAFIPYHTMLNIFGQNDFNWNVAPSDSNTKEFKQVYTQISSILNPASKDETVLFNFEKDEKELKKFISDNFTLSNTETSKIQINKNNFVNVYNKWLKDVQPSIRIGLGWDAAKKAGIIDGDFYLADLLSEENITIREKLYVLLQTDRYVVGRKINFLGLEESSTVSFRDGQKAHKQFWAKYKRPPLPEYWDYIVDRRDLLVPQDIRERKGSYYTPQIWVELSQKYIADALGENWQDEYYVWDCCAGTGNLLLGLTNKNNIWASTLDQADVDVMLDRIQNGANLWPSQVFQFDFLNDEFEKLPKGLQDIINDEEKRKKLVVYINPPYAEAATAGTVQGTGINKIGVSKGNRTHIKYKKEISNAANELFAQFLIRIYKEIEKCIIANFSTLKSLQSSNFSDFRKIFKAKLDNIFLVPANTFDNVKGEFPIGFFVWDTEVDEIFEQIPACVYDKNGILVRKKMVRNYDNYKYINNWYKNHYDNKGKEIGVLNTRGNDFQNQNYIRVSTENNYNHTNIITSNNLIPTSVYVAVRHCIPADWLNDRDQFLFPNEKWETDYTFQADCLTYTLFNNNIQSKYGTNHWIPFLEKEVSAQDKFTSNFMTGFIAGKIKQEQKPEITPSMFAQNVTTAINYQEYFSTEAKAVFDAGRELWKYYHKQPACNVNASLYDIREHFQNRDESGRMKTTSADDTYNKLNANLRTAIKVLAKKIEPKVYEYGFLKE